MPPTDDPGTSSIDWLPAHDAPKIDTSVPHSARVYDYWLGGKTNFAPDREMAAAVERAIPTIAMMARENRKLLGRVVRYLAGEAGIRQFLDIGTGIPNQGNTHDVAQAIAPESRVVYVDNDPIVFAHAQALMVGTEAGKTSYIHADVRQPERILSHAHLLETLDLSKPVGLILIAVLMLISDDDDPWSAVRTLRDSMPSGSYMAISHHGQEFDPGAMAGNVEAAARGGVTLVPRTRKEVERFFGDWEIIEPGVVPLLAWRPDEPPTDPNAAYLWAGVARKP